MTAISKSRTVGVVGAGTMGAGVAQLAAAAGHPVLLFDAFEGAAEKGKDRVADGLSKLVARGRMTQAEADDLVGRIRPVESLEAFAEVALAVEAIVEDLDEKRSLFARLEGIMSADAILATNTSSISVTSIARDLAQPERLVGMHFFNPAPVMKLVEVISGLATSRSVAETVFATAKAWGKVAVHAKSTPGFIVNRVARPFYAEALRLCEEQVAEPATLDALLTEGAGFRMGPFSLMDLIGNDVNYAVTRSIFDAYYQEPRFRPSNLQLELVSAGRLGRKSGYGFYNYAKGAETPTPSTEAVDEGAALIPDFSPGEEMEIDGVAIVPTDGRTAHQVALERGQPSIVLDLYAGDSCARLGLATSGNVPDEMVARCVATLGQQDIVVTRLPDWPGLVVMRTVAMLANEGFEAVLQGVADEAGVDAALQYGVNYPKGPISWAREIGLARVLSVLDAIHALTGDPRYRASMALRMAVGT